jgi:hypothetical protein
MAASLRPQARWASLAGGRHGLRPNRNGHDGQLAAVQSRTSRLDPALQSIQRSLNALRGDMAL